MVIEKNRLIRIAVSMFDLQGHELESTPQEGICYLHGQSDIFPKIEQILEGKPVGFKTSLVLEPEDAFGEFDETAIDLVDLERLGDPSNIYPGIVFEGIPGKANDGKRYRVTEIAEGKAVLDANHPYAGWTLRFDVTVLGIEEPTEEELAQANSEVPSFLGFATQLLPENDD